MHTHYIGSSPLQQTHHRSRIGDKEAKNTQQCWVTESLGEITAGRRGLKEELLVLLGTHLDGDGAVETVPIFAGGNLLQLLMLDMRCRGHDSRRDSQIEK